MNSNTSLPCPEAERPAPGSPPFSPLGWSVWQRLGVAAVACALLWAVAWWALD